MADKNSKYVENNIPHYSQCQGSGGYTLIELVTAIGVFTIGVLASLGLAVSNYNDSQDNLDRITAVNLAREGIELVKNIRDTNWLKVDSNDSANCGGTTCTWNYGLESANSYAIVDFTYDVDSGVKFLTPTCGGATVDCASTYLTNSTDIKLYFDAYNYYYHNTSTPATSPLTKFYRIIKFDRICLNTVTDVEQTLSGMASACDSNSIQIGLQVTSHVQWDDYGETKYVELSDAIYNWRR